MNENLALASAATCAQGIQINGTVRILVVGFHVTVTIVKKHEMLPQSTSSKPHQNMPHDNMLFLLEITTHL